MKPAPFDYVRAASLAEAAKRVADGAGGTVVMAGGQSLMPLLALRVAPADVLVDVTDIAELRTSRRISGGVRIGAGITHAEIEDGKIEDPSGGLMRRVAAGIAYRSIRNHGTIGGSVALADPAADWPACLLALGATVRIAGPGGERTESVDAFLRGAYTTSLQPGEIITAFDVPALGGDARVGWAKVVRKSGAFAMSIGCVVRAPGRTAVVLGGTMTRPGLLTGTAAMTGQAGVDPIPEIDRLRSAVLADLAVHLADADAYHHRLHTATLLRALLEMAA